MAASGQLPEDKVYSKAVLLSIKNQWFSSTEVGIKRRGPPERDPFSFGKLQIRCSHFNSICHLQLVPRHRPDIKFLQGVTICVLVKLNV
ncbi:hypothetical protein OIU84_022058 [Salix udensis]|uniref:Uncharacterized protein n=1 Tax=Salix udensis TaxID=889485 RepID=A0AAD6KMP7_9ROSI|nr:hypothetical protein OIU84_022058 [Salix udensis]